MGVGIGVGTAGIITVPVSFAHKPWISHTSTVTMYVPGGALAGPMTRSQVTDFGAGNLSWMTWSAKRSMGSWTVILILSSGMTLSKTASSPLSQIFQVSDRFT
jgi:hypothetical protein